MNKVFKTVWNASLGVWVAVSETASSQKKGSNKLKKAAANAVATVAIGAATIGGVHAGWSNGQGTVSTDSIAIGTTEGKADASAEEATAVGSGAKAGSGSVSLGFKAGSTGQDALALGANAKATGSSTIAMGSSAQATGVNSLSLGTSSSALAKDATTIGAYALANQEGATSIGQAAQATAIDAIAIGRGAKASGKNAIAVGKGTKAEYEDSIAIGSKAVVSKAGAIVIGTGTASGADSTVIGGGTASGLGAQVFGSGKAGAAGALVLGAGEAAAKDSMALGTSTVLAEESVAVGAFNTINATATKSFILGSNVVLNKGNSVVLGDNSVLRNIHHAGAVNNPVITKLDNDGNVVLNSEKDRSYTMSFAGTTINDAPGAISVGAFGKERQIQYVGAGRITSTSTDAINGSQLYAALTEVAKLEEKPITFVNVDKNGQPLTQTVDVLDAAGQPTYDPVTGDKITQDVPFESQVKLGDTFNIQGATITTDVNGKHTLTVDAAAAAAWKLATGSDIANASTIGGATNTVDFVGSNNAKVSQTELKDTAGNVIGTQVNVEVADKIELTQNGGLTIAGVPALDPVTGAPLVDPNGNPVYEAGTSITINQGNVSFGGNRVENVGLGRDGTDAVNVNQLKGSGWAIAGTNAAGTPVLGNVAHNNQVEFKAGDTNNVTVNTVTQPVPLLDENGAPVLDANGQPVMTHNAAVTVELADQINLSKDGGLTIAGTPKLDANGQPELDPNGNPVYEAGTSITINQGNVSFGGNQLHDVAAGHDDTDAVNVSQLKDALDTLGGGATVNADGSINAPSYTVGAGNTTVNTVGDAIDVLNQGFTLTSSNASGAADETIQAGDKIDITVTKENNNLVVKQDGSTIEFALANQIALTGDTAGLTIGAGSNGNQPIVIQQGNVSFGGNVLQNVGAGVNPTDAVNVSQLQSAGWNIITQNKDAAGNVTGTTENAVNGDKAENTSAVQFNGDNNISVSQNSVTSADGKTTTTIEVELEKDIDLSEEGSLTIGNTLLNDAGLTLAGATVGSNVYGPIVINQGNVSFGGNRLQNVATGVDGTDAVNVDQLKDEIGKAVSDSGWTLTTAGDSTTAEKISPNDTVDFSGDALGNIQVSNTGGNVTIALDPTVDLTKDGSLTIGDTLVNNDGLSVGDTSVNKDGLTVAGNGVAQLDAAGNVVRDQDGNVVYTTGKGDITVEQDNVSLGGNQINDVARADQDHQAVNLGQLKDELGGLEKTINNNINTAVNEAGWGLGNAVVLDANGNPVLDANGDPVTTTAKINPNDQVEHKAGSDNVTVGTTVQQVQLTDANGQPVVDAAGQPVMIDKATVTVDLADQITLTGDNGSLTIGKGNNAITIEQDNISVGGNQIHNLAAGTDGKDAVNVDQLKGAVNIFGGGAAVNPDGSIKAPTYNVNGGSYDNVGDALGALNQADIDLGDRVTNLQQSFNNRIDDVEDRMSAGIASAMALETAPYVPGKYTYAAATAYHNGQAALGITLRKTADNGRWSLTGGVATGTEGDPSVRLGVSGIID